MVQPSSLKEIRIKAGLTQQKMADFLKTTRGHIAMAELGTRSLPLHSIGLLQALEEMLKYAAELDTSEKLELVSTNARMLTDLEQQWDYKLKTAVYYKMRFEHRLVAMIRYYDDTLDAYNSYSLLLKQMPEDAPVAYKLVTRFQVSELQRKLAGCNEACQLKLLAKIDLYSSEVVILGKFLAGTNTEPKKYKAA